MLDLENVDALPWLAEATDGYSGAEIEAVCREAAMLALREAMAGMVGVVDAKAIASSVKITRLHLDQALALLRRPRTLR